MQLNGLLHGARLLGHVDFPTSEVLGPDASEDEIQDFVLRHGPELMEFIMQKSGTKPAPVLRHVPTLPKVPR